MANTKLNKSNSPISDYNRAIVSHCPTQQSATIVMVKKPSVVNSIFNNLGISNKNDKNEKDTECTREKTTFFIRKSIFFFSFMWSDQRRKLFIINR